jgi:hypothetical protein
MILINMDWRLLTLPPLASALARCARRVFNGPPGRHFADICQRHRQEGFAHWRRTCSGGLSSRKPT